jgi:hypothetical protein
MSEFPHGAVKVTKDLDLLLDLDEPEQFVWAAVQATSGKPRWATVHEALLELEKKLAAANEPSPKAATEDASTTTE